MNRKDFLKNITMTATFGASIPALVSGRSTSSFLSGLIQTKNWESNTISELNALVDAYYGDPDDVSEIGRARKMQAFIMELAIKAKSRNPNFQVIPQDTLQYAHIEGNADNPYDLNLLKLLDGWGIENFSDTTVSRLAMLTKIGIKGTANTNGSTVQVVTENQKIATENNILWHPRLSAEVYQSAGKNNPGYAPIYSPSSNRYDIIHDPIPAGVAHTLNKNDVNKMSDAKNYLYMLSSGRYSNWSAWEADPSKHLDISTNAGNIVPLKGGRFQPTGPADIVEKAIADHGNEWDFFWVAKGYTLNEGRQAYLQELAASEWDAFYIDAHFNMSALTREEVESLKIKPQGGRRLVIAYLSIGTTELYRWYADPVMVNPDPRMFLNGAVENGVFKPARERYWDVGIPNWMLWPAYSGQYADESTPLWWHPEWRDIIIRGGSKYKNPSFNHSQFPEGRSSIDRIVDMGFDGVYLDNVSRATSSVANWSALQKYNNTNPRWYLEP